MELILLHIQSPSFNSPLSRRLRVCEVIDWSNEKVPVIPVSGPSSLSPSSIDWIACESICCWMRGMTYNGRNGPTSLRYCSTFRITCFCSTIFVNVFNILSSDSMDDRIRVSRSLIFVYNFAFFLLLFIPFLTSNWLISDALGTSIWTASMGINWIGGEAS